MKPFLSLQLIHLFSICSTTNAQNFVPDPSFEIVRRMPEKKNNSIYCTKNWLSPTSDGASDYYVKGARRHAGVPRNVFGKQKPHSGNAYGGICIRTKFIEYLETKLSDTLIKDQDYLVEFYVSRAERSIGKVKEFGVLFTKKINMGISGIGIESKPSIDFVKPKGYKNKKKWIKLSAVYHAQGNETALILGYFNYDKTKRFRGFSHYYIDDVSVTPIETKTDSIQINQTVNTKDSIIKIVAPKFGEPMTLQNIFFATNKSELLPESFFELDKLVQQLYAIPNTTIKIIGHTDNTGNEEQNKTLSEARAKAVAGYLILKGINTSRINYVGYGSIKPIVSNESETGKQKNRRVEFIITEK